MRIVVAQSPCYVYTGGREARRELPALVFVHGAGHDHSVWNLQARYFSHHGRAALAPDLPGHGASAGRPCTSVEANAEWLVALLDALDIAQAVLVGHSMGSLIALHAASLAPQRISALALVGAAFPMPVAPPLLEAAAGERERAHMMINQWSYSPRGQLGASATPGLCLTVANLRLMERQAPGVLHADLSACNAYAGGLEAAARVRCPTLLVSGERDQMTPARALAPLPAAFTSLPRGPAMVTLPGCGHAIMAEAPQPLTRALESFLGTH